jgi:hypothetical protein
MRARFVATVSVCVAIALACGPALSGVRNPQLPTDARLGNHLELAQAGTFEQRQYDLEQPDERQQQLEQPNSQRLDGPEDDQRQYDLEQPNQRQQDLERPRYDYD